MLCLKLLKRLKNVSVYTATQSILFFFSAIYAEFKSVFCCFAAVAFSAHSKPTDRSVGCNYSNIFHIYIQGFSQKFLIKFTPKGSVTAGGGGVAKTGDSSELKFLRMTGFYYFNNIALRGVFWCKICIWFYRL